METVAIVDEHDQVVGYKLRSELLPSDRIRIIAIWAENSKGEVLIAKRAQTRHIDPGCWGPAVAGGVEKDQTYEETAARELFEELGLGGVTLNKLQKVSYTNSRGRARVCQWYKLDWNGQVSELALQTEEVDAAKWIKIDQLKAEVLNHPEQFVASAAMWPALFNL